MKIKKFLTSALLIVTVLFTSTLSSCLGSFNAFNNLKEWNSSVSDNKYLNNLLFWVLWIIPVYELFIFGDVIILNLIEFWTGDNPLSMKSGESQSQLMTYNGKEYIMTATKNKMVLSDKDNNVISELNFDSKTKSWSLVKDGTVQEVVSINDIKDGNVYCSILGNTENAKSMKLDVADIQRPQDYWVFK